MNFKEFHVTGISFSGRRFKRMTFSSFKSAGMINVWTGSVWGVQENGNRKLLRRIYN